MCEKILVPFDGSPTSEQALKEAAGLALKLGAQAILYRGAGLDVVWPQMLAILAIGGVLFTVSLARFRKTISQMA